MKSDAGKKLSIKKTHQLAENRGEFVEVSISRYSMCGGWLYRMYKMLAIVRPSSSHKVLLLKLVIAYFSDSKKNFILLSFPIFHAFNFIECKNIYDFPIVNCD